MDRYERIVLLHRLLRAARRPVPLARLIDELGCSRATVYRDVAYLRDALGAPLETGGGEAASFRYAETAAATFELPGFWFNSEELAALLALHAVVARADPGVLSSALAPFRARIERLLTEHAGGQAPPLERIRVLAQGVRRLDEHVFRSVAAGVLARQQLRFLYRARSTGNETRRVVSPQRMVHYRDNWYLDAWDEDKDALRSFAVDRMRQVETPGARARDLLDAELDAVLAAGYGIFSGTPRAIAVLRFSAHAARWVADTHWHSQQEGHFMADGRYELKVPYANSRELLMDVLKYGPDAEVVAPLPLREEMKSLLALAQRTYQREPRG